jgi:ribonuclease P protein component
VREHLAALPDGSCVVLRAQPAAATASYAELGAELSRCLGVVRDRVQDRARPLEHTG